MARSKSSKAKAADDFPPCYIPCRIEPGMFREEFLVYLDARDPHNPNEQFRAQLEAAATPEEKRRIVTDAGYDMSRDDLSTIRNLAGMNELSDEDLEKVAGGVSDTQVGIAAGAAGALAAVLL